MGFPFLFALCISAFVVILFWVDVEKGRRDAAAWSVMRGKVTENPPTLDHAKDERELVHSVDIDMKEKKEKERERVEANKDKESDKITV